MVLGLGIHSDGDGEKEGGGEFYHLNWFYFISGMIKCICCTLQCVSQLRWSLQNRLSALWISVTVSLVS